MFYCIVAGSRSFQSYEFLEYKLDHILSNQSDVTIISGGARGADSLAERYAREHGYGLKIFHADWNTFGKSAGYRRNEAMHRFISEHEHRGCVCFWDGKSRGTQHNFKLSEKYDTPLRVISTKLKYPIGDNSPEDRKRENEYQLMYGRSYWD